MSLLSFGRNPSHFSYDVVEPLLCVVCPVRTNEGIGFYHCALYQAYTFVGTTSSDRTFVPQAAVVVPEDVSVEMFENRVRREPVHMEAVE